MSRVIDNLRAMYPFRARYDVIVLDHENYAKARMYASPCGIHPLAIGGVPVVEGQRDSYIIEATPYNGPLIHRL